MKIQKVASSSMSLDEHKVKQAPIVENHVSHHEQSEHISHDGSSEKQQ